jgi:hypothetical protein
MEEKQYNAHRYVISCGWCTCVGSQVAERWQRDMCMDAPRHTRRYSKHIGLIGPQKSLKICPQSYGQQANNRGNRVSMYSVCGPYIHSASMSHTPIFEAVYHMRRCTKWGFLSQCALIHRTTTYMGGILDESSTESLRVGERMADQSIARPTRIYESRARRQLWVRLL